MADIASNQLVLTTNIEHSFFFSKKKEGSPQLLFNLYCAAPHRDHKK